MSINTTNIWLVRASGKLEEMQKNETIGIEFGPVGSVENCNSIDEFQDVVAKAGYTQREEKLIAMMLHQFKDQMQQDQVVFIPSGSYLYIAVIDGDYFYDKATSMHLRKASWVLTVPINRDELPDDLKNALRSPLLVTNLTKHSEIIWSFLRKNKQKIKKRDFFPEINTGIEVELSSLSIDAINILKSSIKSEDPYIRLKAATTILELNRNYPNKES